MSGFIGFMDKPGGRLARIAAGVALMIWGFAFAGGTPVGLAVGIVGIVPLAMGLWGRCLPELFRR
ncbi:MAG TPA: YgaP-like transmembrane domain [Chloroflexota bacterium]|nr:YgaP-like transmembrane domain [Chloroflexota bacterium]